MNPYQCSHSQYLSLQEVTLPSSMSAELKEVINGLLKKNHKERFGCRGRGCVLLVCCKPVIMISVCVCVSLYVRVLV